MRTIVFPEIELCDINSFMVGGATEWSELWEGKNGEKIIKTTFLECNKSFAFDFFLKFEYAYEY